MNMHMVSCIFVMFDLFASNLHKPYNIDLERERSARAAIPPKKKPWRSNWISNSLNSLRKRNKLYLTKMQLRFLIVSGENWMNLKPFGMLLCKAWSEIYEPVWLKATRWVIKIAALQIRDTFWSHQLKIVNISSYYQDKLYARRPNKKDRGNFHISVNYPKTNGIRNNCSNWRHVPS